jgi:hypothetical protein
MAPAGDTTALTPRYQEFLGLTIPQQELRQLARMNISGFTTQQWNVKCYRMKKIDRVRMS